MNIVKKLMLAVLMCWGTLSGAQQNTFPTKPVRIVMGYGTGGSGDVVLRALANNLSQTWGQPVVVDNKPGANEVIAAVEVARQSKDGHTLIFASDSMFSLNPLLRSRLSYDPVKDFTPISRVFQSPLVLFVRSDFPASNVAEFLAYARTNPGKLTYGSTGNGGTVHLAAAWMSKLYGLDMVHVAYNSVANVMQDLTASRIDMSLLAAGPSMPFVASGKLKALAVTGPARLGMAANVTTFAQAGYPEYDSGFYMGLAAPASTPQAITSKISKDVIAALQTPEIKSLFENMGLRPAGESPASFAAFLEADRAEAAKRVQAANIKLD